MKTRACAHAVEGIPHVPHAWERHDWDRVRRCHFLAYVFHCPGLLR